ncbi:MAG: hypothetical protein H0W64_02065 [Gammaproteobacteria bacterium]|nr:hypothetical protein [Gammaproteobacteria bacterium]
MRIWPVLKKTGENLLRGVLGGAGIGGTLGLVSWPASAIFGFLFLFLGLMLKTAGVMSVIYFSTAACLLCPPVSLAIVGIGLGLCCGMANTIVDCFEPRKYGPIKYLQDLFNPKIGFDELKYVKKPKVLMTSPVNTSTHVKQSPCESNVTVTTDFNKLNQKSTWSKVGDRLSKLWKGDKSEKTIAKHDDGATNSVSNSNVLQRQFVNYSSLPTPDVLLDSQRQMRP